jgi:hypothetical protein
VQKGGDMWRKNGEGLDCLVLSAKLGSYNMFDTMMNYNKEVIWQYVSNQILFSSSFPRYFSFFSSQFFFSSFSFKKGPVTCNLYLMTSLDAAIEKMTAERKLELIMHPVCLNILRSKYHGYAKKKIFVQFGLTLVYLILLLIAISMRPQESNLSIYQSTDVSNYVRYGIELLILFGTFAFAGIQVKIIFINSLINQSINQLVFIFYSHSHLFLNS